MQDALEKPLDFIHSVASRFGYPNYRLPELSLVPISADNRRSIVYKRILSTKLTAVTAVLIIRF